MGLVVGAIGLVGQQVAFGLLGKKLELEKVPLAALEEQHRSNDPLQIIFAALMICYAKADVIPGNLDTARRYGVMLPSISDYAATFRKAAAAG